MTLNLWDGKHTKYVSFKETSTEIRLGALYANNMINIKSKFEILEDILVNQLVTIEEEIYWVKDYLLGLKEVLNRLFLGAEQGTGNIVKIFLLILCQIKN